MLDLELMRYSSSTDSVSKVGDWSAEYGLDVAADMGDLVASAENDTESERVTLSVVTLEERPYIMRRRGRRGNDAFDGFAIDLLKVGTEKCIWRF